MAVGVSINWGCEVKRKTKVSIGVGLVWGAVAAHIGVPLAWALVFALAAGFVIGAMVDD